MEGPDNKSMDASHQSVAIKCNETNLMYMLLFCQCTVFYNSHKSNADMLCFAGIIFAMNTTLVKCVSALTVANEQHTQSAAEAYMECHYVLQAFSNKTKYWANFNQMMALKEK